MLASAAVGRRERKKAATREVISSAALALFLERGFAAVGIREVAEHADVAVATIFKHFSSKEALVFDEDQDLAHSLVAAVEKSGDQDLLGTLEKWFRVTRTAEHERDDADDFAAFRQLVRSTPPLQAHWEHTWRRHQLDLAAAIQRSAGVDAQVARLIATLTIEGYLLAAEDDRPDAVLALLFATLRRACPSRQPFAE